MFYVCADGAPVYELRLKECRSFISQAPVTTHIPIVFEERIQADLFAAFLACRRPENAPYEVKEFRSNHQLRL